MTLLLLRLLLKLLPRLMPPLLPLLLMLSLLLPLFTSLQRRRSDGEDADDALPSLQRLRCDGDDAAGALFSLQQRRCEQPVRISLSGEGALTGSASSTPSPCSGEGADYALTLLRRWRLWP